MYICIFPVSPICSEFFLWTRIRPAGCTATGAPGMLRVGVSACGRHQPESMPLSGQRPAVRGGAPFRGVAANQKKLEQKARPGNIQTERQSIHGIGPTGRFIRAAVRSDVVLPALSAPGGSHPVVRRPASADSALSDDLGPAPARRGRGRPGRLSGVVSAFEARQAGSNLHGWVFRVAHNLALKRRHASRGSETVLAAAGDAAGHCDPGPSPEEQAVQRQRQVRLLAVVRALPEQDRCCLHLRAEGLRYREIAKVLGVSLGAVSLSLQRSLARLARADGC